MSWDFISWEFISEVIALPAAYITAFAAVLNIITKINRTLCSLEINVKQLKDCIEKQSEKNEAFSSAISGHEMKLCNIEYKIDAITDNLDKK